MNKTAVVKNQQFETSRPFVRWLIQSSVNGGETWLTLARAPSRALVIGKFLTNRAKLAKDLRDLEWVVAFPKAHEDFRIVEEVVEQTAEAFDAVSALKNWQEVCARQEARDE